jgi:hypothetical protein
MTILFGFWGFYVGVNLPWPKKNPFVPQTIKQDPQSEINAKERESERERERERGGGQGGGGGNRPIIIVHPNHHRPSSYRMVHMEGRVFKNLGEEQSCHQINKGVSFLGTRLLL